MRDVDDTPVGESKSEDLETICALLYPQVSAFIELEMHRIMKRLDALEKQVADLEAQRVANESNQDDPEWY